MPAVAALGLLPFAALWQLLNVAQLGERQKPPEATEKMKAEGVAVDYVSQKSPEKRFVASFKKFIPDMPGYFDVALHE